MAPADHRSELQTKLGEVIGLLKVSPERPDDDVVDNDLILVWGPQKRIITGADLLGRLLRGIVTPDGGNIAVTPDGGNLAPGAKSRQEPGTAAAVHPAE